MALGDNRFAGAVDSVNAIFQRQAITVQVTTSSAGQAVPRDRFGDPTATPPAPIGVQIVVDEVTEDIKATETGGQPIESLRFFALPNTINENDSLTWNGHTFRVNSLWPSTFGGILQVLYCHADRMVGT